MKHKSWFYSSNRGGGASFSWKWPVPAWLPIRSPVFSLLCESSDRMDSCRRRTESITANQAPQHSQHNAAGRFFFFQVRVQSSVCTADAGDIDGVRYPGRSSVKAAELIPGLLLLMVQRDLDKPLQMRNQHTSGQSFNLPL